MRQKSGVILITVLWILLLLALFAFGMGRVSSGEMSLLKISMGRAKAYAAARSGVIYAEERLLKKPSFMDRWGLSGVALPLDEQKKAFSRIALSDGTYFDVGMPVALITAGTTKDMLWGVTDETGRLDINMIDEVSSLGALVFRNLVEEVLPGRGEGLKNALSQYLWGEQEKRVLRTVHFLEELMLVEGFSTDVFKKLKPFLTVYPYNAPDGFRVNLYTASPQVVRAIFKATAEAVKFDGDSSRGAEAFLACRDEAFQKARTNAFCPVPGYVAGMLADLGTARSGIYRIRSVGTHPDSKMRSVIEAIVSVSGKDLKELAWHRE